VESTEFLVYPNPTTDEINISLENSLKASNIKQVLILNVAGQKVYQSNIFQKNISISSYSPGLYFLQLKTDENIHVKKIIIE
jgi:hypothetical protein